jgi:osmotically-inducible protein OsmY
METQKRDKRKVLLVLPLLVTPLLALGLYAMGGGKAGGDAVVAKGINASLPDAAFKSDGPTDKMGFYALGKDTGNTADKDRLSSQLSFDGKAGLDKTAEIDAKLASLNKEINSSSASPSNGKTSVLTQAPNKNDGSNSMKSDIDRLELLMRSMKEDKQVDPEMVQMDSMLEKIMDIQNPARVQDKVSDKISGAGEVDREFLAVPAQLADNMKAVQGSTVRLLLLDPVVLKDVVVPKGHSVFGLCRIVNQRLLLDIKTIRLGELIIPVNLTVYGMDGMPGLSAKDAVVGDVASTGAVDAVSGISVYGMEGVAGQVAVAGIDAAKSLFVRKVKVVRVKLRAGEKVLLRVNRS